MPLINGMKMACEPCIRGHRSTKCTHANERLMVPVKKPGRPLSACPHLNNQLCGCSSITAAIPRKQKCRCGTSASVDPPPPVQPRPVLSAIPDISSPTKATFKVQKPPLSSKPGSRKQSYDLSNLERMDPSNVNISSYHVPATQQAVDQAFSNVHSENATNGAPAHHSGSNCPQPNPEIQNPLLQQTQYLDLSFPPNHKNGEYLAGHPTSNSTIFTSNGSYLQMESNGESSSKLVKAPSNAALCKAKLETSDNVVTFEPQPLEKTGSEGRPVLSDVTSVTSVANGHAGTQHYLFPDNFTTDQDFYSSFLPQTTIYEYPASYGSYQQPLQPSQWHKDFRSNMYAQATVQTEIMDGLTAFTSDTISNSKTQHSCRCGTTCQCIGCVAHPYNNTTRNYVLSAYAMSHEPSAPANGELGNCHANDTPFPSASDPHANENGHIYETGDEPSPPNEDTPSDTSTAEEQILPASDYIFVSYPFSSEGCGGDTNSCPCGEECECIGCTIHRFDESSMGIPSESWVNDQTFTNGDDLGLSNGIPVKDDHLSEGFSRELKGSCCERL